MLHMYEADVVLVLVEALAFLIGHRNHMLHMYEAEVVLVLLEALAFLVGQQITTPCSIFVYHAAAQPYSRTCPLPMISIP